MTPASSGFLQVKLDGRLVPEKKVRIEDVGVDVDCGPAVRQSEIVNDAKINPNKMVYVWRVTVARLRLRIPLSVPLRFISHYRRVGLLREVFGRDILTHLFDAQTAQQKRTRTLAILSDMTKTSKRHSKVGKPYGKHIGVLYPFILGLWGDQGNPRDVG
jgi:hypothetical protein